MRINPPPVSSDSTASPNTASAPVTISSANTGTASDTAQGFRATSSTPARLRWTSEETTNAALKITSAEEPSSRLETPVLKTPEAKSSTRWALEDAAHDEESAIPVAEKQADQARSAAPGLRERCERFLSRLLSPSSILNLDWDDECQREEAYALELRELFRRRMRLVSVVAAIGLIPYAAFYIYLAPQLVAPLLSLFGAMMLIAVGTFALAHRLPSIGFLRVLCLVSYGSFSIGATLVVAVMGQQHSLILGDHNHIVLTTLLLPLMAGESLVIGVFAFLSLAVAGWMAPSQSSLFYAHLFTLANTTIFVLFISHLQSALRRHAFDSAFDIVLAAKRLKNLSVKDALTGGYNRRHLENALDVEVARAVRFERPLSVIMFDLDNFKEVNDSHGHVAGDRVLVEIWNAASAVIRDVDTAARYGGDEFAVVLPETGEVAALTVAQRLKDVVSKRLSEHFASDSLEANVTLSAGIITLRPQQHVPNHEVLALADERLYAAKRNGKNNIAY